MKAELLKCKTMCEMLAVVGKYYDLDQPLKAGQIINASTFLNMAPTYLNLPKK